MVIKSFLNGRNALPLALLITLPLLGERYLHAETQDEAAARMSAAIVANNKNVKLAEKQQAIQDLKGTDATKRSNAFRMLTNSEIKLPPEEAIPLFTELIRAERPKTATRDEYDQFDEFNSRLISELANYGEKSRPALEKIIALAPYDGQNDGVRYSTLRALKSIAPTDTRVLATYTKLLKLPDDKFTADTLSELERLADSGVDISASMPLVTYRLSNADDYIRIRAFYTAGAFAKSKLSANELDIKRLTNNLKRLNQLPIEKASYTLKSLWKSNADAAHLFPLLKSAYVGEKRDLVKYSILNTFGAIRTGSDVSYIRFLLNEAGKVSQNDLLFGGAAYALYGIKPTDTKGVEFLAKALRSRQNQALFTAHEQEFLSRTPLQHFIIAALWNLGKPSGIPAVAVAEVLRDEATKPKPDEELIRIGLDFLYDTNAAGSQSAAVVLELIDPSSKLLETKQSSYVNERYAKLLAIAGRFNITDPKLQKLALSKAMDGLKGKDRFVYAASACLVSKLGSNGSEALPLLLPALSPDFIDQTMTAEFRWTYGTTFGPWSGFSDKFGTLISEEQANADEKRISFGRYLSSKVEAIRAIGNIGLPAANAAIPLLEEAAKQPAPPSYLAEINRVLTKLKAQQTAVA